jgi:hypothetical protein
LIHTFRIPASHEPAFTKTVVYDNGTFETFSRRRANTLRPVKVLVPFSFDFGATSWFRVNL